MYSRIHNKCHTLQQVLAGGIIGLILGNTFFNYKERLSIFIPNKLYKL